jgi:hypothetical protein
MGHWTLSAAIGTAILSSSSASASQEQDVVSGIYVLDEERSENAFQAIDSAIANLPNANRSFARMRLRKSIAVDRIRISIARSRVGIAYDAKRPIVVWLGEEPTKWKLQEGFVFDVSAKANGEAISLTFRADDSKRTTIYRSFSQILVEETSIIVPLLSKPIVYKQTYKRTN